MGAFRLDLRDAAAEGAKALGTLPPLTATEREAAIATWRGRMVNETISSRVFAALLPQALLVPEATPFLPQIADAIADELRHGRQCAAVVAALGGDAEAEIAALPEVPRHEDAGPVEALLRNLLSVSCLSETVAVALIGAERLRAGPDALQKTLGTILADEVQHARLGWELVAVLLPLLDDAARGRMEDWLVVAFRHLVAHELAHLPEGPAPTEAAVAVGVCDPSEARSLFFATVQDVIVPRLEQLGLPGAAAWSRAQGA
ncbi:MAG: ferritin-like domain-containing protein [Deltaproteobacteria bacterium]|nr:ferritin-like domain-containing protein [Deltaproteobacteria bacterium]